MNQYFSSRTKTSRPNYNPFTCIECKNKPFDISRTSSDFEKGTVISKQNNGNDFDSDEHFDDSIS